ncbi:hypothetical protein RIF23_19440 [Lipingzhangella sp. LS1_29]|uniref:Glycosyl transferase family 3 domain-containing protein n=1 Tax=Lipingzhangella rawalii TaxID=2055835 RepID=A0ABU2HB10_9ACTN|nr:hypothetical protein [Lipingzhangella rawalii]MDS1272466.1 hypothetical protein [Lipingzhangella rawalii]
MSDVLRSLVSGEPPDRSHTWRQVWERLNTHNLDRAWAAALLSTLATRLPGPDVLRPLLDSLTERHHTGEEQWPGTVNIVGTGGGPHTVNVSTAAAVVAASTGVPVVKTGSRAYQSVLGSYDLVEQLGIPLTVSRGQTHDALDQWGLAFAGPFVYPSELSRLARLLAPTSLRPFGRFLNTLGPFLSNLPVSAQVTGVSTEFPVDTVRALAAGGCPDTVWICHNELGADELLGFVDNVVHVSAPPNEDRETVIARGSLVAAEGTLEDLAPVDPDTAVPHFLDILAGQTNAAIAHTVRLNAAALAVASGHTPDWRDALRAARTTMEGGQARALVERMRATAPSGGPTSTAVAHA